MGDAQRKPLKINMKMVINFMDYYFLKLKKLLFEVNVKTLMGSLFLSCYAKCYASKNKKGVTFL